MIRNTLLILLMSMATSLIAQNHSTYENFFENRWELPYRWTIQDTIKLNLAKKNDPKKYEYGEFISFKKNKEVVYSHFIPCPVGEVFTTIETFLISEDKVHIYYKTKPWDADDTKWKKEHKKYRILTYDDTTMMLMRI